MRWINHLAAAGLIFAIACGSDDASTNADDYESIVPSEQALTVNAPANRNAALTAAVGETSSYYVTTWATSSTINTTIAAVLVLVDAIADQQPTTVVGDTLTWGPGSGSALDPNVYQMIAVGGSGVYDYHFDYRAKADAEFTTLLSGHSDYSSRQNDGRGNVTIHVDAFSAADGTNCARGDIVAAYDTTVEPQTLTVTFDDFRDCDDDHAYSATYYYDRASDGGGNFEFATNGDIQEGARQPVVNEDLVIRSRWDGTGAGRSDARISGGDLELEGVSVVTASECWDSGFDLTYAVTEPQIVELDHSAGSVSACPASMQEASFAAEASASL